MSASSDDTGGTPRRVLSGWKEICDYLSALFRRDVTVDQADKMARHDSLPVYRLLSRRPQLDPDSADDWFRELVRVARARLASKARHQHRGAIGGNGGNRSIGGIGGTNGNGG